MHFEKVYAEKQLAMNEQMSMLQTAGLDVPITMTATRNACRDLGSKCHVVSEIIEVQDNLESLATTLKWDRETAGVS